MVSFVYFVVVSELNLLVGYAFALQRCHISKAAGWTSAVQWIHRSPVDIHVCNEGAVPMDTVLD